MILTKEEFGDILTVKISTREATISKITRVKQDGVVIATAFSGHNAVEPVGPWSLAGILSTLQSSTLSVNYVLQMRVEVLTAEKDALTAALAALQAKYDSVAPPQTIPGKAIAIALAKLQLSDVWGKAIDLVYEAQVLAEDPDPKHIVDWWYSFGEVNPLGTEWVAVTAEMNKGFLWGDSNETALLALALSVAAETQASAESSQAE